MRILTRALPAEPVALRACAGRVLAEDVPLSVVAEIEGDPEGIRAVTADLGLDPGDYMADSYVDLFFAQGGQGDMVFDPPPGDG